MTTAKVTQLPVETLATGSPVARVTQLPVETLAAGNPVARVTQIALEILAATTQGPAVPVATPSLIALLRNMRIYQNERIDPRGGMLLLANGPFGSPNPVHSMRRLNIPNSFLRLLGAGTGLYDQTNNNTALVQGFSGNPLTFIPFRPEQAPQSWMYVADSSKMVKIGPSRNVYGVGLAPPLNPPFAFGGPPSFQPIDVFDGTTTWANGGTASAQTTGNVIDTAVTHFSAGSIPPYAHLGLPSFWGLTPTATTNIVQNMLVKVRNIGSPSTFQLSQIVNVFTGGSAGTIVSISYVTGTDGFATINLGTIGYSVSVGQLITLGVGGGNQEDVYVGFVEVGPDGTTSIFAYTQNTHAASETTGTLNTDDFFGDGFLYENILNTGGGAHIYLPYLAWTNSTGTGYISRKAQLDLQVTTNHGARQIQTTDTVNIAVQVSDYTKVTTLSLLFDVDQSINNFTVNYYEGDFSGATIGTNSWTVLSIPVSSLSRVGSSANTLANTQAIRIQAITTGNITVAVAGFWIGGNYGPNTGANPDYQWEYRYRGSLTGSKSNGSPASIGVISSDQSVVVVSTLVNNPEVDTQDFYRFGGTLTGAVLVDSVMAAYSNTQKFSYIFDVFQDADLAANPVIDTDQFQPFPTIDFPRSGICNTNGTTVTQVSGDVFNVNWSQGTVIVINGTPYNFYQQPTSNTNVVLTESAGVQTGVPFSIIGATILGQPLPCLWGPFTQGSAAYGFACGDTYQPGVLFLTNGNTFDAASDTLQMEITPPSEPLMNGCMYNASSYVWSSERLFRLDPNFGQGFVVENGSVIPASGTDVFVPIEVPDGKGLFARWAFCAGPKLWYRSRDGIYETTGGQPKQLTVGDFALLFPHEGQPGIPVYAGPYVVYPPDDTKIQYQKMSYYDGFVYFDYLDITGLRKTLVYDTYNDIWSIDDYSPQVTLHYGEEGAGIHDVIMGAIDGNLYQVSGNTDGSGLLVQCGINLPLMSEGIGGFSIARMAFLGLSGVNAGSPTVSLGLIFDNGGGNVALPGPSSYARLFTNLPPLKGRLLEWYLSCGGPFTLFMRDGEFYVRAWADKDFKPINPFAQIRRAEQPRLG